MKLEEKKTIVFCSTFTGDQDMRICGAPQCKCHHRTKMEMFEQDVVEGLKNENAKQFRMMCNCLPDCTSIKYDVEIDRVKTDIGQWSTLEAAATNP